MHIPDTLQGLHAVGNWLQIAAEKADPETSVLIAEAAQGIRRVLQAALEFATDVSLLQVCESAIGMCTNLHGHVPITLECAGDVSTIRAQAYPLYLAITDLLLNALHAIDLDGDGAIHVVVERTAQQQCMLCIQDNGAGLPPDVLDAVMVASRCPSLSGGLGLGITTALRTFADNGGKVTVDSTPSGTTYTICFGPEERHVG